MLRFKYAVLEKLTIIEELKQSNSSYRTFAKTFSIGTKVLKHWLDLHELEWGRLKETQYQGTYINCSLRMFDLRSNMQLRYLVSVKNCE